MRDQYQRGGLLAVVGPSGSGKSSLLRAGLIPAIRNGALDIQGAKHRPMALFTPGTHPMGERARHQELASGNGQFPAVIVVDQFVEEVFTLCQEEEERRAFIAALCAAGGGTGLDNWNDLGRESEAAVKPTALIVLGLRADFYPHVLRHPELVAELQRRQVLVGPMTEEELRSAITGPAMRAASTSSRASSKYCCATWLGGHQEQPAAAHEPGTLPLLSHALLATWDSAEATANSRRLPRERRHPRRRRRQRRGSLRRPRPARQDLTRRIFTRLVHVAETQPIPGDGVEKRLQLGDSDSDIQPVLDAFIGQRLITADTDTVEIAHEALLRAWPRLRQWIDADSIGARTIASSRPPLRNRRTPIAIRAPSTEAAAGGHRGWASASSQITISTWWNAVLNASVGQASRRKRPPGVRQTGTRPSARPSPRYS